MQKHYPRGLFSKLSKLYKKFGIEGKLFKYFIKYIKVNIPFIFYIAFNFRIFIKSSYT